MLSGFLFLLQIMCDQQEQDIKQNQQSSKQERMGDQQNQGQDKQHQQSLQQESICDQQNEEAQQHQQSSQHLKETNTKPSPENTHNNQQTVSTNQTPQKCQKHKKPALEPDAQHLQQQIKKQKKMAANENQERINYLVQVSRAMVNKASKNLDSSLGHSHRVLAAQTGALASAIGRRCVTRLEPALKRTLCKGCGTSLVYGVNARVRHRSRRQKHLVVTCLTCHTIKRFVNDPKHKLWCEQEEAIL